VTEVTDLAALAHEVHAWAEAHWDPDASVATWWARLADAGWSHPAWPTGLGGSDRTGAEARAVLAALAAHDVVAPPRGGVAADLAAPTILTHGTPGQVRELVRPIATGETAWCQLFSEPGAGSDLAGLTTRAVPDGDGWVVTGQKVWSSGADRADVGMLLARTDPEAPRHQGLTYFAIDMDQPGVEVRPLVVMSGSAPFCEVFLTGARVPDARRIGGRGEGWRVARTTLASERAMVAGGAPAGLHQARSGAHGDLQRSCREIVGRSRASASARRSPLRAGAGAVPAAVMVDLARRHGTATDPRARQVLARYWSQVKVNGWTMRRSAAAGGRLTGADGSVAKLSTARICQQSREVSCRVVGAPLLLGGAESPFGGDLQRVNLDSPGTRIGGGTDEIQLDLLGEKALGLPRDRSRSAP
jgi:alkylation response protein AidB-like acyl-CoA dehydrogenase